MKRNHFFASASITVELAIFLASNGCALDSVLEISQYYDEHGEIMTKDDQHCGKKGEEDCTKKTDPSVKEFFCSKDAKYQCIPKEYGFGWKLSADRQSCECDGYKDERGKCTGRDAEHGIDISTYQNFLIWFALCI